MAVELADNIATSIMNEDTKEANEREQHEVINKRATINLSVNMELLSNKNKKYQFNYRLFVPFCLSILCAIFANADVLLYENLNKSGQIALKWFIIVFSVLLMLICIYFLIYGKLVYKGESLMKYLNEILNIQASDTIYMMNITQYVGTLIVMVTLYVCITMLIFEAGYHSFHQCSNLDLLNKSEKSSCLVHKSANSYSYAIATCMAALMLAKTVKDECINMIDNEKETILQQYSCTKSIDKQITEELKQWRSNKEWRQRKCELCIEFLICFALHFGWTGITRNNLFSEDYETASIIIAICFYCTDTIILTVGIYLLNDTIYYHFEFPSIIMKALSVINANDINDIIGWSVLRKYYILYVINIYVSMVYEIAISVGLIGSGLLSIGAFILSTTDYDSEVIILFLFWLLFVASMSFITVTNGVRYHRQQLYHKNTINQQRLTLATYNIIRYKNANKIDEKQSKIDEITDDIINRIYIDIQENSYPMSVFGARMDDNFMIFIRATFATIFLAYLLDAFA